MGCDWYLFNITMDIEIPTIFGFCMGRVEYGDFLAVRAATRATYADALRKTVRWIGQSFGGGFAGDVCGCIALQHVVGSISLPSS